jgi:hypothetical protein
VLPARTNDLGVGHATTHRQPALARVAATRAMTRSADGELGIYLSTGTPGAEIPGGCQIEVAGRDCRNPGRHELDGVITCTTHRKAIERRRVRQGASR